MKQLKNSILPVIIGVCSIYTFIDNLNFVNIPKVLVSIIGIIAIILFSLKKEHVSLLIKIWIFAQIPAITSESEMILNNGVTISETLNYWETAQFFNFHVGVTLNSLSLYVNIVPFLFLGFYRLLKASEIIGKTVEISNGLRRENKLGNIFPLSGDFVEAIKFDDKTIWMLTQLNEAFLFKGVEYRTILLHPREDDVFKMKKTQLGFLRLVHPETALDKLGKELKNYPFIDYVGVTAQKNKRWKK